MTTRANWYSSDKAKERTILERYRLIINYFVQNPDRATTDKNKEVLTGIYNDKVLMNDEGLKLRKTLLERVFNSEIFKLSEVGV